VLSDILGIGLLCNLSQGVAKDVEAKIGIAVGSIGRLATFQIGETAEECLDRRKCSREMIAIFERRFKR
jgi:hypothetical protein